LTGFLIRMPADPNIDPSGCDSIMGTGKLMFIEPLHRKYWRNGLDPECYSGLILLLLDTSVTRIHCIIAIATNDKKQNNNNIQASDLVQVLSLKGSSKIYIRQVHCLVEAVKGVLWTLTVHLIHSSQASLSPSNSLPLRQRWQWQQQQQHHPGCS
jgi:hypothetical protein